MNLSRAIAREAPVLPPIKQESVPCPPALFPPKGKNFKENKQRQKFPAHSPPFRENFLLKRRDSLSAASPSIAGKLFNPEIRGFCPKSASVRGFGQKVRIIREKSRAYRPRTSLP